MTQIVSTGFEGWRDKKNLGYSYKLKMLIFTYNFASIVCGQMILF